MKHLPIYLFLFLGICLKTAVYAQNKLVGTSVFGGEYAQGTIFSIDLTDETLANLHVFQTENPGKNPNGSLVLASNHKLYGMLSGGGKYDRGVLFSVDTLGTTYEVVVDFVDSLGSYPVGSLIDGADGKMYGMTPSGGTDDLGVIFSLDQITHQYQVLHSFDGLNGAGPQGDLLKSSDGLFYGMTRNRVDSTVSSSGTLFSFDPTNGLFQKLLDFNDSLGISPYGSLMEASDGLLYGMTFRGGVHQAGVLFSYNRTTSAYAVLYDFDPDSTGKWGRGDVLESNGKLYGMTRNDGLGEDGCIFSYDLSSGVVAIEYSFDNFSGNRPFGSLEEFNGLLYGTTTLDGPQGNGSLFSFDPVSKFLDVKHAFDPSTGASARGEVIFVNNKAYGLTYLGETNNNGVLFTYTLSNDLYHSLLAFSPAIDGGKPTGNLIKASDGLYYGLTEEGGIYGKGVLFSFNPQTNAYLKRYDFSVSNRFRNTGVMEAQNGKLYGVLSASFAEDGDSKGELFEYDPVTGSYQLLKTLFAADNIDGASFSSIPVEAAPGKLIGTTYAGGINQGGVIYQYDYTTQTYTVLHRCETSTGIRPSGLVQGKNDKLYGTAQGGDSTSSALIFEYDLNDSTYSKIHEFQGSVQLLTGDLLEVDSLVFYGNFTSITLTDGKIFRYDLANSSFSEVFSYAPTTANRPGPTLHLGADSIIYGSNFAEIYSFDLTNSTFDLLDGYTESNLSSPGFQFLFEGSTNSISKPEFDIHVLLSPNPASQAIQLQIDNHRHETIAASIRSLSGQLIWQTVLSPQEYITEQIDLEQYPLGLYIMQIQSESGQKTIKFLKQ